MSILLSLAGLVILIASILWGWSQNLYLSFVTMVLGYWLLFEGLNRHFLKDSIIKRGWHHVSLAIILGAVVGILLDFNMFLTKIMHYKTMDNLFNIFLLYLGWGISLPAMYESTRFFSYILPKNMSLRLIPKHLANLLIKSSVYLGMTLNLIVVLFFIHSQVPGYFVAALFLGQWLIVEYYIFKTKKIGLLQKLLEGNLAPLITLVIAAVLFCLAWEVMNVPMQHWEYVNLFWLEPKIAGIPLVAFFGYFCWFTLYLSFYQLVTQDINGKTR